MFDKIKKYLKRQNVYNFFKETKFRDYKKKEKAIIFLIISMLISLLILTIFYTTIYANVLKNPKEFNNLVMYEINNFKIYKPNLFMYKILHLTPNAVIKTNLIFKRGLIAIILIHIISIVLIIYKDDIFKKNEDYGKAKWSTFDDLGYSGLFGLNKYAKPFEINLLADNGVVIGEFNGRILKDNAKTHILLSAPTRTGKGVSVIIPTLVDSWKDSVLVIDIKGENYQKTAGWRQKEFNNKILRFSPKSDNSCKYNPLSEIRYLTNREIEDARVISELLVISEGGSGDNAFWDNSGADFILGVIMYELYKTRGKAGLSDVVKFITDPSDPLETRMKKIIKTPMFDINKEEDGAIIDKLLTIYHDKGDQEEIKNGYHPFIKRTLSDTLQKGEKTLPSIVATVKTKLSVFEMPTVEYNTSISDFKIKDLMAGDKALSLYIVIEPGDLQSLAPLLRILIIQCVNLLTPEMDYTGKNPNAVKFKRRLLMVLDEFPAIGKMDILEKGIGFVGGYGIKMMVVVQSVDQLNKIYTKDNMFMSNTSLQIFYTANENETAKYISDTLGNKTVKTKSVSSSGFFKGKNTSISYTSQPLIRPDEVRKLPASNIIVLRNGTEAIKLKKILYFDDKRFKHKVDLEIKDE